MAAISEYQKRLSAFTKVRMLSYDEYQPDSKEIVIALTPYGETVSSEAFSAKLHEYMLTGCSRITFLPAPTGSETETLCISNIKLSDALTACVLHEQVYRSFMIMNNRTYHK